MFGTIGHAPTREFARRRPLASAGKRRDKVKKRVTNHSGILETSWLGARIAAFFGFVLLAIEDGSRAGAPRIVPKNHRLGGKHLYV
jgi:hypothetical protein